MSTPGYSATPLARKLGIAAGHRVLLHDAPADYLAWLAPLPDEVRFVTRASARIDLAHAFVRERDVLSILLVRWRQVLPPATPAWISWPKRAAKVPTTITEDVIREVALPLDYVDIKVCAVSPVWSGLKLVVRRQAR